MPRVQEPQRPPDDQGGTQMLEIAPGLTAPLPGHISSSQRSWLTCRRKWALGSALRLRPKEEAYHAGLIVGSMMHEILATWYSSPPESRSLDMLTGLLNASVEASGWPDWERQDLQPRLVKMCGRFWRAYGEDGIQAQTEVQLSVPLRPSVKWDTGVGHYIEVSKVDTNTESRHYLAYVDALYEDGDTLVVEDWKTAATQIEPSRYTVFNPQGDDYVWALQQLYPDRPVELRYLFITQAYCRRVSVPPHDVSQNGEQLRQLAAEQRTLPLLPNYGWHCQRCKFAPVCSSLLTGRPVGAIIQSDFTAVGSESEEESDV